mgnify:CR=1 FL=1
MLNCEFVRERGIERTSTSRSTQTCWSRVKNSPIGRVEWPIVKIVGIFLDRRARFVIIIYNKDYDMACSGRVRTMSDTGYAKAKSVNHHRRSRGAARSFSR